MNALAMLVLTILLSGGVSPGTQDDQVWWWFSTCGGPMMTIEVKLQGATVGKGDDAPVSSAARRRKQPGRPR